MKSGAMVLSAALALSVTACSAPSNQTAAAAAAQTPDSRAPASNALTTQAFAGEFVGTIACGDCQGIQTKLQLNADGKYQLDETFVGRPTNNFLSSHGQWKVQDGHHFVLVPSEQGWDHRLFEVLSKGEIRQLGDEGKPYTNDSAYHLKRVTGSATN
ncbi:copper resistance protein NlpE [Rhodanobacter sp. FW021-MT20]|uniref:copper resistance protein NlpE n=1 Tax=Rhodanobacter sp. FW021-MT20 TaxID=1162282 RepID=UPI0034E5F246